MVNPSPQFGPNTWRLAINDAIGAGPGGGGNYDFDGVEPIEVDVIPGISPAPDNVKTSLDFEQLDER